MPRHLIDDTHEWNNEIPTVLHEWINELPTVSDYLLTSETTAMAVPMFSASFRARVEKDIPWVLEAGYDHDEPSGKMRRERFIYMLEFGHQLLARAIERDRL